MRRKTLRPKDATLHNEDFRRFPGSGTRPGPCRPPPMDAPSIPTGPHGILGPIPDRTGRWAAAAPAGRSVGRVVARRLTLAGIGRAQPRGEGRGEEGRGDRPTPAGNVSRTYSGQLATRYIHVWGVCKLIVTADYAIYLCCFMLSFAFY